MRRYLLGFLGAFLLFAAILAALVWAALANWLFSDSPLWFDLLFWFGVILPFPMTGDLVSRRSAPAPLQAPLVTAAAVVVLAGLLIWSCEHPVALAPLAFPLLYHLGWHWGQT